MCDAVSIHAWESFSKPILPSYITTLSVVVVLWALPLFFSCLSNTANVTTVVRR